MILLFTDLVGSTAQRTRVGEEAAEQLRREHDHLVAGAIALHDGRCVKSTGDGLLAAFEGAADALGAAVSVQMATTGEVRGESLDVRIGMSAGDVVEDDGDLFGSPVVEAARLCDRALGGQILVADVVSVLARGRGDHDFESLGPVELKGLPDQVPISAVHWTQADITSVRFASIDDHPAISDSLALAARDYDDVEMVASFTSIESVPHPLRTGPFSVDVVVLDLNLAGLDGMDGVEMVSAWDAAVLVYSANTLVEVVEACLQNGAAGFVGKSVPTRQVLDGVREVAAGRPVAVGVDAQQP